MTIARRFVVVGNGKMASDILQLIDRCDGAEAVGAIGDPRHEAPQSRLAETCARLSLPYLQARNINTAEAVDSMVAMRPDFIVSANNFQIFRGPLLGLATYGIVNFHNGPLPRYGGLNACSWALINGEATHGVTWHMVDAGIDSGPILAQRQFEVAAEDRAITLIARCIQEGIGLFQDLLPKLVAGAVAPVQQSAVDRLYYGMKDKPFAGDLPWWEGEEVLSRLSRALSFHPLPNLFYRPRFGAAGFAPLYAGDFSVEPRTVSAAGTVANEGGTLVLNGPECRLLLDAVYDAAGDEIPPRELGTRFGLPEGAMLQRFA